MISMVFRFGSGFAAVVLKSSGIANKNELA